MPSTGSRPPGSRSKVQLRSSCIGPQTPIGERVLQAEQPADDDRAVRPRAGPGHDQPVPAGLDAGSRRAPSAVIRVVMYCMSRENSPAADPLEEESSDRPGTRTGELSSGMPGPYPDHRRYTGPRPTGSSCTPASASTTPPRSPATSPPSASATSTARRTCRRRRAARTATTWSTTRRLNAELGGARRRTPAGRRAGRAGPRPGARHRAQPHGARRAGQRLVVGRARERAVQPLRQLLRHRLGPAGAQAAAHRADARSSATTTAGCSRRASCAVEREGGVVLVRYYDHEAPLSPAHAGRPAAGRAAAPGRLGELATELATAGLGRLPGRRRAATDPAAVAGAAPGQGGAARPAGRAVRRRSRRWPAAIDAEIDALNGDPDAPRRAAQRQNYRLAYWRTAAEELVYRRFFDIETLVGLRVEEPRRSSPTPTAWSSGWSPTGTVDGLRIDHVDGLRDPEGYLDRLRDASRRRLRRGGEDPGSRARSCPGPGRSPGTTGYDFLNRVGRLFVDPAGEAAHAGRATPGSPASTADYAEVVPRGQARRSCATTLAAEVERLTDLLAAVCERPPPPPRPHPPGAARRAARGHRRVPGLPHLRPARAARSAPRTASTWPRPWPACPRAQPGHRRRAARRSSATCSLLRPSGRRRSRVRGALPAGERAGHGQGRGGHRLLPLPAAGLAERGRRRPRPLRRVRVAGFHQAMAPRHGRWPETMLTLSTHDTKRSARRAGPDQPAVRAARARGSAAVAPLGGRSTSGTTPERLARPQHRVPAVPDAGRRLADRPRTGPRPSWRRRPGRPRCTPRGPTRRPGYDDARRRLRRRHPRRRAASSPTWRRSWPSTGSSSRAGSTRWPRPRCC